MNVFVLITIPNYALTNPGITTYENMIVEIDPPVPGIGVYASLEKMLAMVCRDELVERRKEDPAKISALDDNNVVFHVFGENTWRITNTGTVSKVYGLYACIQQITVRSIKDIKRQYPTYFDHPPTTTSESTGGGIRVEMQERTRQ
jgi:hypothetical protein